MGDFANALIKIWSEDETIQTNVPYRRMASQTEELLAQSMTRGSILVSFERKRQIDGEGWSARHDATFAYGQLSKAATGYVMVASSQIENPTRVNYGTPAFWPWSLEWWKPVKDDAIRNLVKAGALICAEIDRILLQRQQS